MKIKINNIDEFCEALKAGYLLRSEDVDIQLKENMFYFSAEGLGNVSDPVHIFHYEKPDPLKIKCGKYYQTRDGQKAAVMFKDESSYPFYGMIESHSGPLSWDKWGKNAFCADYDLVSELKEGK